MKTIPRWASFFVFTLLIIFLLSACTNRPEVRAVKAVKTLVEATVTSVNSGTVKAEQVSELSFGTVGRVKLLSVKAGSRVKQSEILAELENGDLLASLHIAELELGRLQGLYKDRVASTQELDKRKQEYDIAKASYEKSLVRAPFDGFVAEVNIEVGQLSQITAVVPKPLIQIIDVAPRYVKAQIDEVDLSKLKEGLPARVKILAVRPNSFNATVRKVTPFISTVREQDRTSEIELSIQDEGILLPVGASADVDVVIGSKDNVLAIPTRTVLGHGAERYVYIAEGVALKKVSVTLGVRNFDRAEVLLGLKADDTVVFPSDSYELSEGLKVTLKPVSWP